MTTTSAARSPLDVGLLLERAQAPARADAAERQATGLADFRPALRRLCAALLTEAELTDGGARSAATALVTAAATFRRLCRFAAGQPALAEWSLPGVVVITGLHRTGTTLLQNLLAEHPDVRSPRLWELMHPVGGDRAEGYAALVSQTQSYIEEYYRAAPDFRAIHALHADRPEECHRLIAVTFLSEIYALRYHVPSYLEWLERQDHGPAYQTHRLALRAIHWRIPGGSVVVLKCPFHLWHAPELAAAYPGARVVRMHRDPADTIASGASLTAAIRGARSVRVDRWQIGSFWLGRTTAVVDSYLDTDRFAGLPVLDIRYPDLVRDPIDVARRVCEFVGIPLTPAARLGMRRYLTANPPGGHGTHRYRAEDFGLRTSDLAARFAEYRARFRL